MSNALAWETSANTLLISGTLGRESLMALWEKRQSLFVKIDQLDVSGLNHVDSTGLAMLVRLKGEFETQKRPLKIVGMSDNLTTLMDLYGVSTLLLS
ncbi:phospholipid transport system transporter-binding protein [Providencia alcalifaciens]|nr:phospholipid transport system transporter-binding protein [Providencia alcalifaciens]